MLAVEGLDFRLKAIGPFEDKSYEGAIKKLVARYNLNTFVEWTGFCSDVNRELDEMDVLVLPSLRGEGMPMVVLEALASGVPVIGTCVEGVPEVVREGIEGLLVEAGKPLALAEAMRAFLLGEVDWTQMSESAKNRHRHRFSDVRMAEGVAAVYRECLW